MGDWVLRTDEAARGARNVYSLKAAAVVNVAGVKDVIVKRASVKCGTQQWPPRVPEETISSSSFEQISGMVLYALWKSSVPCRPLYAAWTYLTSTTVHSCPSQACQCDTVVSLLCV